MRNNVFSAGSKETVMAENDQGKWFVVQTLSGHEQRVQERLLKRRELEGVEDLVTEVQVPTETVSEVRRGKKTTTTRKQFPGYILVRVQLYTDDGEINSDAWYFIKDTQGVIGFVGGEKPVPLPPEEVDQIMAQAKETEEEAKPKVDFDIGETVTIKEGPFENFEGAIESVDPDRGKLRLSVSIFGRSTPVEVEYWQVERG